MQTHIVEWTSEKIKNFWDYAATDPHYSEIYFSKEFGKELVAFARTHGNLRGLVLDYGCGSGHLLEELVRQGYACAGVDSSAKSLQAAREKIGSSPLCKGLYSFEDAASLAEGSVDFIFVIETVEHLLSEHFSRLFQDVRRMLKPGGQVFVTTPYRERLEQNLVCCPDCGAVFHRMQHVRSWTEDSLAQEINTFGFKTAYCAGMTLWNDTFENKIKGFYRFVRRALTGRGEKKRHLLYLGTKA